MDKEDSLKEYKSYVKSMLEMYMDVLTKVMFGDFKQRAKSKKDDEFAAFSIYLNTLIASLERKEKEDVEKTNILQKSKEELQLRVNELEKFHKLVIGRELKMVRLKKRIEKIEKQLANRK